MKPALKGLILLTSIASLSAAPELVTLPGKSPLVTFRILFQSGAASDPKGKEGLAQLTAAMLAQSGSKALTYQQILDRFFPMATSVAFQLDQEMTVFTATVHRDNLEAFYGILKDMLLAPGWREDDLKRVRADCVNNIRTGLRGNNDEELAKEYLYELIYRDHPYGHLPAGHASAIEKLTIADLQAFYKQNYTQSRLTIGLGGGYPDIFPQRVKADFSTLPAGQPAATQIPAPAKLTGVNVALIDKPARAYAISIGYPYEIRRGHPDFPALLVAQSWLGQHRSGGRLFDSIRDLRGLNYGDYAYLEYFPRGMFQFEPDPNIARRQQIFQLWIRPCEPATAHFALRLALHEFQSLIEKGLTPADFEKSRNFQLKYVNLLIKTKSAELGYEIDSRFYNIPAYSTYLRSALAKLTLDEVNKAIRKHFQLTDLQIVVAGPAMEDFRRRLLADAPSPITYNSPKPANILNEDKAVADRKLKLDPARVTIVPYTRIFE